VADPDNGIVNVVPTPLAVEVDFLHVSERDK
jgi:hypothetical protein